jgi:hypothetical protein
MTDALPTLHHVTRKRRAMEGRGMAKKEPKLPVSPAPRRQIVAERLPEESDGTAIGRALASPANAAARVMAAAEHPNGLRQQIDLPDLVEVLRKRANAVQAGDLSGVEAMLTNQASALQSLFVRLAERGMGCDSLAAFEGNMRMALRAQNQARATLETLSAIKNPPVVFARQANIANGPQQVNNGVSRAETETPLNKVLQEVTHERMDPRTPGTAGRSNQTLEAVATVNRTPDR